MLLRVISLLRKTNMFNFIFGFIIIFFLWFAVMVEHFAPAIVSIFFAIFYLVIRYIIKSDKNHKKKRN